MTDPEPAQTKPQRGWLALILGSLLIEVVGLISVIPFLYGLTTDGWFRFVSWGLILALSGGTIIWVVRDMKSHGSIIRGSLQVLVLLMALVLLVASIYGILGKKL